MTSLRAFLKSATAFVVGILTVPGSCCWRRQIVVGSLSEIRPGMLLRFDLNNGDVIFATWIKEADSPFEWEGNFYYNYLRNKGFVKTIYGEIKVVCFDGQFKLTVYA